MLKSLQSKKIFIVEMVGVLIVFALAFVFHFMYEWSGGNFFVGLFSATNESVFQHTKILFFPFTIFAIIEYFFISKDIAGFASAKKYFTIKAFMSVLMAVLIIVVHYTYTGVIGYHIAIVDIVLTFVYALIGGLLSYYLIVSDNNIERLFPLAMALFIVTFIAMLVLTYYPPKLLLFYDTLHRTYLPYN